MILNTINTDKMCGGGARGADIGVGVGAVELLYMMLHF
jgi:hypothetical protein